MTMVTEQESFNRRSDDDVGSTPKPDPTTLTSEALKDAISGLRTLIDQRISATETLFETKIALGREGGEALKELLTAQLTDLKDGIQQFRDEVKVLFGAAAELLEEKFEGRDKALLAALEAAKEAVEKANVATEKRFDALTLTLSQLNASMGVLLPRAEAESRIGDLDRRVSEIKSTVDKGFTGVDVRQMAGGEQRDIRADSRGGIAIMISVGTAVLMMAIEAMRLAGH